MSRKLLILDLNGTLLHRAQSSRHNCSRRPYLSLFISYLFHPETQKWMDVMVWSSAQPHNVSWMVSSAFGANAPKLQTVWARDRMGLSQVAYSSKVQTTKDLSKVWAAFPSHSTKTTFLVDDSPAKARLQPYNHICLSEYIRLPPTPLSNKKKGPFFRPLTILPSSVAKAPDDLITQMGSLSLQSEAVKEPIPNLEVKVLDQTLLAVIGILDKSKEVTDVSKWIEDDGLFFDRPIPSTVQGEAEKAAVPVTTMWFIDDDLLSEWAQAGLVAAQKLGLTTVA